MKPLVLYVLDSVLQDFDAESKVEVELHIYYRIVAQSKDMEQQFQAANCRFCVPDWAAVATCQRSLIGRLAKQASWLCELLHGSSIHLSEAV